MVLLVTKNGQQIDPERRTYLAPDIENYTGATRRQITEWVNRHIISADIEVGRGNAREYSFWNVFQASVAKGFGVIGRMKMLEDTVRYLFKTEILNAITQPLPNQSDIKAIKKLREEEDKHIYMFIGSHDPLKDFLDIKKSYVVSHIGVKQNGKFVPIALVDPSSKKSQAAAKEWIQYEMPDAYLFVDLTRIYCKLAEKLIASWE